MKRGLFVFIVAFAGAWGFPWWWPAVPGFFAGAWDPPGRTAPRGQADSRARLAAAAVGGAFAWGGVAAWIDLRNGGVLSARIAPLFHLPGGWMLVVVTALLGGITAMLGAWAGVRIRAAASPQG